MLNRQFHKKQNYNNILCHCSILPRSTIAGENQNTFLLGMQRRDEQYQTKIAISLGGQKGAKERQRRSLKNHKSNKENVNKTQNTPMLKGSELQRGGEVKNYLQSQGPSARPLLTITKEAVTLQSLIFEPNDLRSLADMKDTNYSIIKTQQSHYFNNRISIYKSRTAHLQNRMQIQPQRISMNATQLNDKQNNDDWQFKGTNRSRCLTQIDLTVPKRMNKPSQDSDPTVDYSQPIGPIVKRTMRSSHRLQQLNFRYTESVNGDQQNSIELSEVVNGVSGSSSQENRSQRGRHHTKLKDFLRSKYPKMSQVNLQY